MSRTLVLAAAVAAVSFSSLARAEDSPEDIKAEINSLQRRLAALEAREQQATIAAAVQGDALQRSQLLQTQGFTAGYDKGFKIQSADGKFLLQPGLQFQFRNITNFTESDTDDDSLQNGFEVRRLRVRLDGNLFSKNLKYSFVFDNARNSGSTSLLDAWASYTFEGTPYTIKFGQFRNSWVHEGDVADIRQLAVERSLVDYALGGSVTDRVQGVEFSYGKSDEPIRAAIALHDGDNSKNTDWRDSDGAGTDAAAARNDANFGASGRFEYKVFGNWSDYRDFTAKGAKEDLLVLAAGVDYSQNGDSDVLRLTVDGQYENTLGFSGYGAVLYNYVDTGADDASNWGALAQVGYLVTPNWEPFARYSVVVLDNEVNGEDTFHEIAAGVNYYFGPDGSWGHNVKFTLDLNYLPNGVPLSNSSATGLGYLAGTEDQFALRAQFQIAF